MLTAWDTEITQLLQVARQNLRYIRHQGMLHYTRQLSIVLGSGAYEIMLAAAPVGSDHTPFNGDEVQLMYQQEQMEE